MKRRAAVRAQDRHGAAIWYLMPVRRITRFGVRCATQTGKVAWSSGTPSPMVCITVPGDLLENAAMIEIRNTLERCPRALGAREIVWESFTRLMCRLPGRREQQEGDRDGTGAVPDTQRSYGNNNNNNSTSRRSGGKRASRVSPSTSAAERDPPIDIQSESQLSVFVSQNVYQDGTPI